MKEILYIANQAARSEASILIQGESGTGKEMLMKYIYSKSFRSKAPLIEVNCSAIPENLIESELFGYESGAFTGASSKGKKGLFELANKGTLFLDEIGELPFHVQSKLLRALQEKEIMRVGGTVPIPMDVRVISATNVNLEEAMKEKRFRGDLFYRLNVIPITLPPLRDRREDILALIEYFVSYYRKEYKKQIWFSELALRLLTDYDWPGNIRELQNLLERIFIIERSGEISASAISEYLQGEVNSSERHQDSEAENQNISSINFTEIMSVYEKNLLLQSIHDFSNIREYADFLGLSKSTLARKLQKHNITFDSCISGNPCCDPK